MHFTVIKFSCQCWASKSQNSRYGIQLVSGWFWQIEKLKFLARSWFQKEIMQQKLWEPARQLSQSLSNMQKLKYLVFSVQYFNSTTNVWLSRYFLKLTCFKSNFAAKKKFNNWGKQHLSRRKGSCENPQAQWRNLPLN